MSAIKLTDAKVLFIYSDAGMGHKSLTDAMSDGLAMCADAKIDSLSIEFFSLSSSRFWAKIPRRYQILTTNYLWLYNLGWYLINNRLTTWLITVLIHRAVKNRLVRLLKDIRPDVIVATAPFISNVVALARRRSRIRFKLINVVADLVTLHNSWASLSSDLTVVFTRGAYLQMLRLGIPKSSLMRQRFPVRKNFITDDTEKVEFCNQLGIATDRRTLLITGGGVGAGPLLKVTQKLQQTLPETQLIVVTGRNEKLRAALAAASGRSLTKILGYTLDMRILMGAADLVLTKGGSATIMEAWAMKRPVVVIAEVGIQERGNGFFVEDAGVGYFAPDIERMIQSIKAAELNTVCDGDWRRIRNEYICDGLEIAETIVQVAS